MPHAAAAELIGSTVQALCMDVGAVAGLVERCKHLPVAKFDKEGAEGLPYLRAALKNRYLPPVRCHISVGLGGEW